ncbi:CPBP family intramembrane metalloprotease [Cyanobium sp. Cruz-8D1]|nr:CPBP family intramembrane metalloprotease [Cyanobium sp. Cruz-8H5]MCP9865344.1 CPBP family intramembrane metalloprotease [Cyanobium sp. Cruz-8D1]
MGAGRRQGRGPGTGENQLPLPPEVVRLNGTPSRSGPPTAPPGWKSLLALLSLALCALLWLGGLIDSLERPSVVDSLSLRQLELGSLAAEAVPPGLRPILSGEAPRQDLTEELRRQLEASEEPPLALRRLELALLERSEADPAGLIDAIELRQLATQVDAVRRPLIEALLDGGPVDAQRRQRLLAPWSAPLMVQQLVCEQLPGGQGTCPAEERSVRLLLMLVAVTILPALFLLAGVALLLRQGWMAWRQRLPAAPPLLGPPLSPVDVTLLIAGGFVVLGEVVVPIVVQPPLQLALQRLESPRALSQGLEVLVLYAALMAVPLLLLALMLPRRTPRPAGGWLQWKWRPAGSAFSAAIVSLLMVLPVVTASSWVIERFWSDPGGSNPLLELVLTSADPLALACFAFTALVVAPLFEEVLFRGVLLPVAGLRLGGAGAVILSAAVFAIAHLSLAELAPLFVLGLGLGWLRWRSGRLGSAVLMHALWNGLTFMNLLFLAD